VGGRVPQPLSYLIGDVARRHGQVLVRPVACCIRSDDTALLAEIARARSLAKLHLTELAATVLASAAPAAETLAALRAAGYVPASENPDGSRALELAPKHRATPPAAPPVVQDIGIIRPRSDAAEILFGGDWADYDAPDDMDLPLGYPFAPDEPVLPADELALILTGEPSSPPTRPLS
jgi:hypothetical protein